MRPINTAIAASLLALLLTACATTDKQAEDDQTKVSEDKAEEMAEEVTDREPGTEDAGDGSEAQARGAQGEGKVTGENLAPDAIDQAEGPLSKRVVYFAFDSSEIKTKYAKLLAAHGEYLGANPDVSVTVEGHTDERGSREYNLALGERRAESVKQVLTLNGADAEQIETVSYGEERPAVQGHDEEAWSKNRRAKLVYSR